MDKLTAERGSTRPIRLAILNSHPIQYFAPLYAYLNSDPRFEVTALYMSDISLRGGRDPGFGQAVSWDIDLLAGYRSVFLGDAASRRTPGGFLSLVAPQVWREVRRGGYDALWIHGHNFAGSIIAVAAAKSVGIPVFIRGDTHGRLPRSVLKNLIRTPVMRVFYRFIDAALAVGTANAEYYRSMGFSSNKIFSVPYAVDNARFIEESRLSASERKKWRRRFGIPGDRPAILYAAKFTQRKRPTDLLVAAHRASSQTDAPFTVVMCGSGELEPDLRAYAELHGIGNVVFTGFVNQAELPKLYGASDAFVLPSENEPWGLAVNEAMCASLPVVVSAEVGCVPDLVGDGVNGFIPVAGDIDALAVALARLAEDEPLRRRMGKASRDRVEGWSYLECLEGVLAACQAAIADPAITEHLRVSPGPAAALRV